MIIEQKYRVFLKYIYLLLYMLIFLDKFNPVFCHELFSKLELIMPLLGAIVIALTVERVKDYRLYLFFSFFLMLGLSQYIKNYPLVPLFILLPLFKYERINSFVKFYAYVLTGYLIINIVLSTLGFLPFKFSGDPSAVGLNIGPFTLFADNRYIFSFVHHNCIGLLSFSAVCCWYYLCYKNHFKKYGLFLFGCIATSFFLLSIVKSRTGGYGIAIVILLSLIQYLFTVKKRYLFDCWCYLCKYAWLLPIILFFVFFLVSIFYNSDNYILSTINAIFSGRASLTHEAINTYGIPLFGQSIAFCGYGCEQYFYVDSMYAKGVYEYGLVLQAILLIFFCYRIICIGKFKNFEMVVILVAAAFVCLSEEINFLTFPFLIGFFMDDFTNAKELL